MIYFMGDPLSMSVRMSLKARMIESSSITLGACRDDSFNKC